jgi:hypothetical protein
MRIFISILAASSLNAQILPGTKPLSPNPDFSATMVAGIDKMALRLIEQSKANRNPTREKLKAAIGIVDEEEARITFEYLKQIGEIGEMEADDMTAPECEK